MKIQFSAALASPRQAAGVIFRSVFHMTFGPYINTQTVPSDSETSG